MLGVIGIIAFFVLLTLGVPIAFSLFTIGFFGLLALTDITATLSTVTSTSFNYISSYTLSVVPLFILMGMTASKAGILDEVFDVARKWFGGSKAGEGIAAIAGNTVFAAASGSSLAACVVIGRGGLPAMEKAGYPRSLATGIIASSGTIAAVIPPSILICIYGIIVDQSIGKLLIAGIIPGIIEAILYASIVIFGVRNLPKVVGVKVSFMEKVKYTSHLWVIMFIILAIMGTIYAGVCTPTEAGAIGAFTVFLLCLALGRLNFEIIKAILKDTVKTTGMILIILVGAAIFSRFLVVSGFTEMVTDFVTQLPVSKYIIFTLVVFCYLLLGCFLTATGMMVVSLPVVFPAMMALGFDPIWFGIIVVTLCEIALITPPVGMNTYVVQSLNKDIPLTTIFVGCSYFLVADLVRIAVITAFPVLVLFLPEAMY